MLSMAGSVLSCKNAQLARDFQECILDGKVCVCCPPVPLLRPCPESGQELKVAPNSTCDEARGALKVSMHPPFPPSAIPSSPAIFLVLTLLPPPGVLTGPEYVGFTPPQAPLTSLSLSCLPQNLLFSVCGLTVCAAIICTLSAIVCCIQIFSLDLVHTVSGEPGSRPRR